MLEKVELSAGAGQTKYNAANPDCRFVVSDGSQFYGLVYTPTPADVEVNQHCKENGVQRSW